MTQSSSEAAVAQALTRTDDPNLCSRSEPGDIGEVFRNGGSRATAAPAIVRDALDRKWRDRLGRTCPSGQMTVGAYVLGERRSTHTHTGRGWAQSRRITGPARFSGLVLVRVGLGETGLQVTDDGAELA